MKSRDLLLCGYCEDPPHPRCNACLRELEYWYDRKTATPFWWCRRCQEEVPSLEKHHTWEEAHP